MLAIAGTEALPVEIGSKRAQFNAAEKGGKGMAFKIFTGAKPFLKANIWPFGIKETEMLTLVRVDFFRIRL
jgi:hypothetical protein